MIAYIDPAMANYIAIRDKNEPKTEDDKHLNAQWIKIFLFAFILTALGVALFIMGLINHTRSWARMSLVLTFNLVLDVYIVSKFIKVRVIMPGRFKKAVAKIGIQNIIAQLSDPTTAIGFFVDENNYDNLLVLTQDYLIQAKEFVYALRDIKSITVSKTDVNEEQVKKFKNEHFKNVLRRTYSMELTLQSGAKRKEVFAINTGDMQGLFGFIQQRAPHIFISYK